MTITRGTPPPSQANIRGGLEPSKTAGRSKYLEEFLNERWDSTSGYLCLDELPPTENPIGKVINRLLDEAKFYYGDNVKEWKV